MNDQIMVQALLQDRFPEFTDRVQRRIKSYISAGHDDTSDEVLEAVLTILTLEGNEEDFLHPLSRKSTLKLYIDNALEYRNELDEIDEASLRSRYIVYIDKTKRLMERFGENVDRRAFYSRPGCEANYSKWNRLPKWTVEEAAALSYGFDPTKLNSRLLEDISGRSPFKQRYSERVEALQREFGNQNGILIEQEHLFAFACRFRIELPERLGYSREKTPPGPYNERIEELERQVMALGDEIDEMKQQPELFDKRNTMFKIIMAMAIKKYHHKVGGSKNNSTKNIADDIAHMAEIFHNDKLLVGLDTVKSYLDKGAQSLSLQNWSSDS